MMHQCMECGILGQSRMIKLALTKRKGIGDMGSGGKQNPRTGTLRQMPNCSAFTGPIWSPNGEEKVP